MINHFKNTVIQVQRDKKNQKFISKTMKVEHEDVFFKLQAL